MRKKRYLKIQDCFEFLCPERWEGLEPIEEPGVKHCGHCDRNVYKATNKAQLLKLGEEGKCAAYFAYEQTTIGIVLPPMENVTGGLTSLKDLITKPSKPE